MTRKFTLRIVFALFVFAFIASVGATVRPVLAQSCDSVTDDQIRDQILTKIKSDSSLSNQGSHINVSVINLAVRLQGWTDTKKDYDKVIGFVYETKCVKLINVNMFEPVPPPADSQLRVQPGGCSSGTKQCGDVCIPVGDSCNITGKSQMDE